MGKFFISQESARLDVGDGEWVEIKKELSFAESQKVIGAGVASVHAGENKRDEYKVDFEFMNVIKLETWIVDWSFTDDDKAKVPVSRSAICNLQPDLATKIVGLIEKHQTALEEEKKAKSTELRRVSPSA